MLVIGEKINIMSKTIGPAMKERDAGPIQRDGAARRSKAAPTSSTSTSARPPRAAPR